MTQTEIWKDIHGHEGRYQISSLGRVKSIIKFKSKSRNKILSQRSGRSGGYLYAGVENNGKKTMVCVHRLVAIHFIPKVKDKNIVNHLNGIVTDNRVSNLEWCDKRENMIHAMEVLGVKRNGANNPNARYTDNQVKQLIDLHKSGKSIYACAKELNFKRRTAYAILNNEIRKIV